MECRSLGVWLPGPLGDLIMATPALEALRSAFPDARRVGYALEAARPVLDGSGLVHEVQVRTRDVGVMGRLLRRAQHDLLVLLTDSFRSGLIAWRSRTPRRVGYRRGWRGPLLTDAVPRRRGRHPMDPAPMVELYLELLRGADLPAPATGPVRLATTATERAAAAALLERWGWPPGAPLVAISPGAAYGSAKRWPPERFAAVAEALTEDRERQIRVVLLHAPSEEPVAREVLARCTHQDRVLAAPTDLGEAKAILELARLHVTNDTGARHLGHALGTPTVVLLGPTHQEWSEYPGQRGVRLQVPVPCGPCMKRDCPLEVHRCMVELQPDMVLQHCWWILEGA
jgi:heptosyltransferase-2